MPSNTIFDTEELQKQINGLTPDFQNLKKLNQALSICIGLFGILLSLGGTISGIILQKDARISAIFGACAATTQAILFAYPVDRRARAYQNAIAKLQNLLSDLKVKKNLSDEEIQALLEQLKGIRLEASLGGSSGGSLQEEIARLKELLKEYEQQNPSLKKSLANGSGSTSTDAEADERSQLQIQPNPK